MLAAIFIFFFSVTFFLTQYDKLRLTEPGLEEWYQAKVAGTLQDGDQYRIAIPFVAHFLQVHLRLELRQSLPLIQSVAYAAGLTALYCLLVTSEFFQRATVLQRVAMCGFFFAAVQLPVLWIFPWERPETLPTMCYLALISLIIVSGRVPLGLACVLAVGASFAQAFARSDAPMVVGLACWLAAASGLVRSRSRWALFLLGLLCGMTGAAVHLYLVHHFPPVYAGQRATDLQLLRNLDPRVAPIHVPVFLTALLPFFFSLVVMRRYRMSLDAADRLTGLIALIYLPIYMTFGILAEIRIYVPYLFLLSPLFAKVWTRFLLGEPAAQAKDREIEVEVVSGTAA